MSTQYKMIPIYNSTRKATAIKNTQSGPIAKIDGVWYSVNGNISEIVDVRYPLQQSELLAFGVSNDR